MLEWKIGKVLEPGYLLKIICVEDCKEFTPDLDERTYQLVLFKKGSAVFHINGRNVVITAPSVLCISDRDEITCISDRGQYEMNVIYFHPSTINCLLDCDNIGSGKLDIEWTSSINQDRYLLISFFEREHPTAGCFKIEVNVFNKMVVLFNKLQEQLYLEVDGFWPCRSRSYLIEILIMIQMKYLNHSDAEAFIELTDSAKELNNILDFIHTNYSTTVTIDRITKKFGINRNALNQRFKTLTGYTPISYLINHRLKVAESLLVNTQVPVHEICERVGFSELSNFMRSFKKQYGESPASYRSFYTTM